MGWYLPDHLDPRKVYFVECVGLDMVKIGIAQDPWDRIKTLQIANPLPLRLLAVRPNGSKCRESHLHKRFAAYHVRGEWFRLEGRLLAYIKRLQREQEREVA